MDTLLFRRSPVRSFNGGRSSSLGPCCFGRPHIQISPSGHKKLAKTTCITITTKALATRMQAKETNTNRHFRLSHAKEMPFIDAEEVKCEAHDLLISKWAPSWQHKSRYPPDHELGGVQEADQDQGGNQQRAKVRILLGAAFFASTIRQCLEICAPNRVNSRLFDLSCSLGSTMYVEMYTTNLKKRRSGRLRSAPVGSRKNTRNET